LARGVVRSLALTTFVLAPLEKSGETDSPA
jgi:hypothetical protein